MPFGYIWRQQCYLTIYESCNAPVARTQQTNATTQHNYHHMMERTHIPRCTYLKNDCLLVANEVCVGTNPSFFLLLFSWVSPCYICWSAFCGDIRARFGLKSLPSPIESASCQYCSMNCPELSRQDLSKKSDHRYFGLASYSTIASLLVCVVLGNAFKIYSFCLSLIFDICPNGESVNRGWAHQASI